MSADNNNNNSNEVAAAAVPNISVAAAPLGISENTANTRATGRKYLNQFMREEQPFGDDNIQTMDMLTPAYVDGDNLERFIQRFYTWLGSTAFWTSQNTWLSTENKIQYRKYAKQALREQFPTHPIFGAAYAEWHEEIEKNFKKTCKRSRQDDDNITEVRKSEPLYRDVTSRDNCAAIRAKYLGIQHYDCKTIASSLLEMTKDKDSASKLAEFNMNRAAHARGSEHVGVRWDEGTYDPYFQAPDFDWIIYKQLQRQCMFFFCDLSLYMICPFFGLAVYFLFGGLRRDDADMGPSRNFIFPHLHNMKRSGVAERMTKAIRSAIDDASRKKAYTSRSMRKGTAGELRMNRDVSLEEHYAHSGHNHPSYNSNAETYIEPNPVISAPGAMASAGYINCHMRPTPYSFEALGLEVFDKVQKLVSEMFVNDMHRLQVGGNLRPVLMISAARLIGSYNDLIKDVGTDHKVVKLIMEAARRAGVDDARVEESGGPRYHVVLKYWSRLIKDKFTEDNDQVSPDDPKVNEELLRKLIGEVEKLKTSSAAQEEREHRLHTLLEQVSIQSQEMAEKDQKIKDQEKQINRLQRMLNAASQGSPSSPIRADQVDVRAGGKRPPPPINLKEDFVPPAQKKTKSASTTTTALRLDGVQNTATEDKVGGITVSNELERMWKEGYLSKMREDLEGEETLSKEVLFMRQYTDLYGHPAFKKGGEMAKYDKGMSFVAIAITRYDDNSL
jgi:hypothetical protein